MKNPVINVTALLEELKKTITSISNNTQDILTPEQIKELLSEAVQNKDGKAFITFSKILESIKKEAFISGQINTLTSIVDCFESITKEIK